MYRTDRIYVSTQHEMFPYFDELAHKAKNLYNASLFRIRNTFTAHDKTNVTSNEKEVLEELALLKGQKTYRVLGYGVLQRLMRVTQNPDFFAGLPMQSAQATVKHACSDFQNWLSALKKYKQNPALFTGKPRMPGYCKGDITTLTLTNQDAVIYGNELKLPKTKQRLRIRKRHNARLQEVKVCPVSGGYDILLVYQVKEPSVETGTHSAAVDFGVGNTMAVVADTGDSILFKGEYIKSINQYFNKEKAWRVSVMSKGDATSTRVWSKKLDQLSAYRTNYIRDCFHKMSRLLMKWCKSHEVGYLVLGSNKFWKQEVDIDKRNNQNFVSIPFEMLKSMIELKSNEYGITVMRQEESYTSKASFIDLDFIPVYSEEEPDKKYHFSGRRIHRGLYKSADGTLINADINGAANILRKAGYDVSNIKIARLLNPAIVEFTSLNCK